MPKINVTQEHIDKGVKATCWCCPIALAINDVLKRGYNSRVTTGRIKIYSSPWLKGEKDPMEVQVLDTPTRACFFIRVFDHPKQLAPLYLYIPYVISAAPFSFDLPINQEHLR